MAARNRKSGYNHLFTGKTQSIDYHRYDSYDDFPGVLFQKNYITPNGVIEICLSGVYYRLHQKLKSHERNFLSPEF